MTVSYPNNYNRVKPGHINFPRMLRNFRQKTDQVRTVVWHSPTKYAGDGYGVESNTVRTKALEVPDLLAKIQPITTKDFQLAKEGKWITGAAKIYIPSMEWLYKHYSLGRTYASWNNTYQNIQTNYNTPSSTTVESYDNFLVSNYAIDGLMDNVFYDNESTVLDFQYTIEKVGATNWNATTDYSGYLGADWSIFTQDASNSCVVTSDNNSITITVSGTSNSDTQGTVWFNDFVPWPPVVLASRFSLEYYAELNDASPTPRTFTKFTPILSQSRDAATYPYIKYGSTGSTITNSLGTYKQDDMGGTVDQWQKYDLPFTSGAVLANTVAASTGSQLTTSARVGMGSWLLEDTDNLGTMWGNSFSCIRQTPNAGTLNTVGVFDWENVLGYADCYFGFRLSTPTIAAGETCSIKFRNMKWYRAIPWSVHSVKELGTDYQVLNCVRDDGQSINQQIANDDVTTL